LAWQSYSALCLFTTDLGSVTMSSKKERLEALKQKRDALAREYQRIVLVLSSMHDQIADVNGDIRMLENEQERKST
jgi:chromosome segregation ATPase